MPPKKKVKTEAGAVPEAAPSSSSRAYPPVAVKSEEGSLVPDAAPSSGNDSGAELFEFKFVSMGDTAINTEFENYAIEGRFHIPLVIDPESGVLSVPNGVSDVKGFMLWKVQGGSCLVFEDQFEAKVVEKGGKHVLRFGYSFHYYGHKKTRKHKMTKIDWDKIEDVSDLYRADKYEFISTTTIEDFAAKTGGELEFRNRDRDVLTLYTVISELRPGQMEPAPIAAATKIKPNWNRLEQLAQNHSDFQDFDIKAGLTEYKRFMAMKLGHKDSKSEKYAPSRDVDKVWHLHLVFPEQYQQDILAFAKELKAKEPFVVPHCPFLNDESRERYEATLKDIRDTKLKKIVGKDVDFSFWPDADEMFPEDEDAGCGGCC